MDPSFSISKPKYKVKSERRSKIIIQCQNGTVPIIRNTKNAQYWAEKHFHPLTDKSHGTHIAGVRSRDQGPYHGLAAWMSVHDLNGSKDQISYANIYVGSAFNEKLNFIQTGWMVNPSLFGDRRTWSFGIWKVVSISPCYPRKGERALDVSIVQDKESGNWWTTDIRYKGPDKFIGYWPKEVFDLIDKKVDMVGVTGEVQASSSGISPPMGNGHLPSKDETESKSARVKNLLIVDSNYNVKDGFQIKLEKLIDNEKCYGLKAGQKRFLKVSNLFTYGGPGGKSCGI